MPEAARARPVRVRVRGLSRNRHGRRCKLAAASSAGAAAEPAFELRSTHATALYLHPSRAPSAAAVALRRHGSRGRCRVPGAAGAGPPAERGGPRGAAARQAARHLLPALTRAPLPRPRRAQVWDVVVVGAGVAGSSLAFRLGNVRGVASPSFWAPSRAGRPRSRALPLARGAGGPAGAAAGA